jgi:hypothetical protein
MNMLNVWVNRAITHPNIIDGVYTDPEYACSDCMQGFETVQAYVVSTEFMNEVLTRTLSIAEGMDKLEASIDERSKTLESMEKNLDEVMQERLQLRSMLHRCVNHLSETTQPDLMLERDIRVALGLSTVDVEAAINMFEGD